MPNYTITVTYDHIKVDVDFNDLAQIVGRKNARVAHESVMHIQHFVKGSVEFIEVGVKDATTPWQFSVDGANETIPVGLVNGVAPTDNSHLYDLLKVILE